MPRGDAVQKIPTIEEQMAAFKGFSTTDGEVSNGDQTAEEAETLANREATRGAAKKTAKAAEKPADDEDEAEEEEAEEEDAEESEESAEDESEESEDSDEEPAEKDDGAKKPKSKRSAQERINEVTRARRSVERELARERARNDALEARLAAVEHKSGLTQSRDVSKEESDEAPKPEDFEYGELDAGFIRALARYEARQEFKAEQRSQQKTRQSEADAREAQELAEKKQAFEEVGASKYDDFQEVVVESAENGDWPLSASLGKLMLGSEFGPDVAYHLATHPKEAREVFGKSPMEQAAYFGRQEAKFSARVSGAKTEKGEEKTPPTKVKATQAPPPPKQRAKGAGGRSEVSADSNDFTAFERMAMR